MKGRMSNVCLYDQNLQADSAEASGGQTYSLLVFWEPAGLTRADGGCAVLLSYKVPSLLFPPFISSAIC